MQFGHGADGSSEWIPWKAPFAFEMPKDSPIDGKTKYAFGL
jgi:hypothetical protein